MPDDNGQRVTNALLGQKLDDVIKRQEELKGLFESLRSDGEQRERRLLLMESKINSEEHTEEHKDIRERLKSLESLAPTMKVVTWIGGVLGISVLALIWALITGQAIITFAP